MVKKGAAALMAAAERGAARRATAAELNLTNAHCKEKVRKVQNVPAVQIFYELLVLVCDKVETMMPLTLKNSGFGEMFFSEDHSTLYES